MHGCAGSLPLPYRQAPSAFCRPPCAQYPQRLGPAMSGQLTRSPDSLAGEHAHPACVALAKAHPYFNFGSRVLPLFLLGAHKSIAMIAKALLLLGAVAVSAFPAAEPIIGGSGDFKYQYMPELMQVPDGCCIGKNPKCNAHGLVTDKVSSIPEPNHDTDHCLHRTRTSTSPTTMGGPPTRTA